MSVNDSGLLFFPSTQQLQVKWQHHGTFRRFVLEYQAGRAFEALVQKCSQIVPTNDYDLVWFDQEGDPIRIESECDMEVAIREKQGNLLRIHSVKKETPPPAANNQANNEGVLHPGIQCDLCDKYVIGTRFKCLLCADYDLCQKCETTGEHKHHAMLRIVDPNYTIVPWGGRLRGRPGYCPVQGFGRRGRGPFHQSGLFAEHRRNESEARDKMEQAQEKMDETRKKFEEKREELLKQFHSEEWKKTYKTGLDFLNGVGQQIQQALANFGIDATIESMDIRPPKEEEKKEDKAPEQPMETETPPQPQPEPKGSNVELVEPAQNPPQSAPLHPFSFRPAPPPNTENNFTLLDYLTRPTAPSAPAIPMPAPLPVPHAIPMPAPMPYPHAIPMPPPRMAPPIMGGGIHLHHPSMASHPAPQQAAQQPMPQEPLPTEVHVTATLHGNNPSAQSAPSAPTTSISAPVITDAPRITETMIRDWVLGDVYPRVNPNDNNNANMPPLNELQKGIYQQLMRMGFDDHRRAYQAARLNPEDINAAIDCFFNMKLD